MVRSNRWDPASQSFELIGFGMAYHLSNIIGVAANYCGKPFAIPHVWPGAYLRANQWLVGVVANLYSSLCARSLHPKDDVQIRVLYPEGLWIVHSRKIDPVPVGADVSVPDGDQLHHS